MGRKADTTVKPRKVLEREYQEAAEAYMRSLTLENFMEAPGQATQREITLESCALVKAERDDMHVFNELLVQWPNADKRKKRKRQVVPDNMIVLWKELLKIVRSYDVPLQPCGPFWVMEYVSKTNERKDYDESMAKYEHELKVPYYSLFVPEQEELTLYRHNGTRYVSVQPNDQGRYAVSELEMEIGLLGGWVRYWYQGELLPLPAELKRKMRKVEQERDEAMRRADAEAKRADAEAKRADAEAKRADNAVAELARLQRQLAELQKTRKR